jgi:hypothetical protein
MTNCEDSPEKSWRSKQNAPKHQEQQASRKHELDEYHPEPKEVEMGSSRNFKIDDN